MQVVRKSYKKHTTSRKFEKARMHTFTVVVPAASRATSPALANRLTKPGYVNG